MSKVSTDDRNIWPYEWDFTLGKVRTRRTECSDVSKVAREIDEGLPLRAMASRLESRTYSSL